MRPVLEQHATPIDEAIERAAIVDAEPAPRREVVRAIEHVDRIHRYAARVARERDERTTGQPAAARTVEMLAGEEQRGDGAERKDGLLLRGHGAATLPDSSGLRPVR